MLNTNLQPWNCLSVQNRLDAINSVKWCFKFNQYVKFKLLPVELLVQRGTEQYLQDWTAAQKKRQNLFTKRGVKIHGLVRVSKRLTEDATDHWLFLPPSRVAAGWEDQSHQKHLHGRGRQHPTQRKQPPPNHQIPQTCDQKTPGDKQKVFQPTPPRKTSQDPSSGNERPATKNCSWSKMRKSEVVQSEQTNLGLTSAARRSWSCFMMDRSKSSSTRTKTASKTTKQTTNIWKQCQTIRNRKLLVSLLSGGSQLGSACWGRFPHSPALVCCVSCF